MDKQHLSESDICDKFIRPAMERAGWNGMEQIYREYPLRAGRVVVRGQHAQRDRSTVLRADYALFYKANIPLAAVEAKDASHAMGAGMAQAIQYAELLGVPFCFASNGEGFVFRDATLSDGVVERFNGRISEIVRQTRFASAAQLEATLMNYVKTYNHHIPQRALKHVSPVQALKDWYAKKPELFKKRVYKQAGLDS